MPTFAYVRSDVTPGQIVVWEILDTSGDIASHFPGDFHSNLIDVTGRTPLPQPGWIAQQTSGVWTFHPSLPPVLTLVQQAQKMLGEGIRVKSMSNPATINATYPLDAETRSDLQAEMLSLLANGVFTNGSGTLAVTDVAGNPHEMSVAQFKSFVTALGRVVTTLKAIISTNTGTLPAQPVVIA